MKLFVAETPWNKTLFGLSRIHVPSREVSNEIVELLGTVWEVVRNQKVHTTGINYVVYGENGDYFCGLECNSNLLDIPGLTVKQVSLDQYVVYKHIGPYAGIPQAYSQMLAEMEMLSLQPVPPSVEIYGHWNNAEALLETELLLSFIKRS
jgi:hypothetical protein